MRSGNNSFTEIYPRAWSYQTALRDVLPDGRLIGNDTDYSPTTRKYQNALAVETADVVVTGVPRGTEDLVRWYRSLNPAVRAEHTIKGRPVIDLDAPGSIVQRIHTSHDTNGNPRRLQLEWDLAGDWISITSYAYADPSVPINAIDIGSITVTPAEYHSIIQAAKAVKKFQDGI